MSLGIYIRVIFVKQNIILCMKLIICCRNVTTLWTHLCKFDHGFRISLVAIVVRLFIFEATRVTILAHFCTFHNPFHPHALKVSFSTHSDDIANDVVSTALSNTTYAGEMSCKMQTNNYHCQKPIFDNLTTQCSIEDIRLRWN